MAEIRSGRPNLFSAFFEARGEAGHKPLFGKTNPHSCAVTLQGRNRGKARNVSTTVGQAARADVEGNPECGQASQQGALRS